MRKTLVVAAIAGWGQLALAQPTPPETGTPPGETEGPPAPPPPPQPQPQPPPVVHVVPAEPTPMRPTELAFGIGAGYNLPASLDMPNAASVRLRLPSGLTFEPRVVVGSTKDTNDNGTTATTDARSEVTLATLIRKPFISHGRTDFEGIGGISIGAATVDPDGDDNNTTTTTFALDWGIGVGFWINQHWQVSASATNPLFQYQQTKREMGAGMTTKDSTTSFAIAFAPTITFMIHLYN